MKRILTSNYRFTLYAFVAACITCVCIAVMVTLEDKIAKVLLAVPGSIACTFCVMAICDQVLTLCNQSRTRYHV